MDLGTLDRRENKPEMSCPKCDKKVIGEKYHGPFSLHTYENYIFECECGETWEREYI